MSLRVVITQEADANNLGERRMVGKEQIGQLSKTMERGSQVADRRLSGIRQPVCTLARERTTSF